MVGNDTSGLYAINPIAEQSIYKKKFAAMCPKTINRTVANK